MALGLLLAGGLIAVATGWVWVGFLRFRRRVLAYLDHCPDIRWHQKTPTTVLCMVLGYPLEADLLTTFIYQRRALEAETRLLEDFVAELRGRVPPVPVPLFAHVRDLILPLLKRTAVLLPTRGYRPENHLLYGSLDEDVSILYVVDGLQNVTYITEGMVHGWGIDRQTLHVLALTNLRRRTEHMLEELGGPRTEYVAVDGYDATRVLIADLIVPRSIEHPVAAIPSEHACLIAPLREAAALAQRAIQEFQRARVPLTLQLYRLGSDGPIPLEA